MNKVCQRVALLGNQIHGSIAFCWDHDMHLYYKQAKLGEAAFGVTSYHEEIVAEEMGL